MRLSTRRLILRPIRASDADGYFLDASDETFARDVGMPRGLSVAAIRKSVRAAAADWKRPGWSRKAFTILRKSDGARVGGINLRWPHGGVGELGYGIHPDQQGRGYATEAVRRIVRLAFEEYGAHRVQATCWVKNVRSAAVLKKAGLRKEGVLRGFLKREGAVRDEFMWGVTRADRRRSRSTASR